MSEILSQSEIDGLLKVLMEDNLDEYNLRNDKQYTDNYALWLLSKELKEWQERYQTDIDIAKDTYGKRIKSLKKAIKKLSK